MPVKNEGNQDEWEDGGSQTMIAVDSADYLYRDQARSTEFASCHKAGREEVAEQCNLYVVLE
jgi:hypothetical protein